jgi:hypothetical protein
MVSTKTFIAKRKKALLQLRTKLIERLTLNKDIRDIRRDLNGLDNLIVNDEVGGDE